MSKSTCTSPGCERPAITRGLCEPCYLAARRAGTIECKPHRHALSADARFWSKVGMPDEHGCLPWFGSVLPSGYGQFYDGANIRRAHRYAFELAYGPLARSQDLHHTCGNLLCVNPLHMTTTTSTDHACHHNQTRPRDADGRFCG